MHNLNRRVIVAAISSLLAGLAVGYFIWGNQPSEVAAQSAPVARESITPQQQPVIVVTPPVQKAIVLTSGSETDEYNRIYACSDDYQSIDVAVGKVISPATGTQFELSETRDVVNNQASITAKVTLGKDYRLGGVIIVTAAHEHAPTVYPEFKLDTPLDAQGNATFTLQSSSYVENYYDAGITHLTFCVKPAA